MSTAAWRRVRDFRFHPRVLLGVVEEKIVVQVSLFPVEVFSAEQDQLVFFGMRAQRRVQPEHGTDHGSHRTLTCSYTGRTFYAGFVSAYLGDGGGQTLSTTCVFFASSN